jgi:hypothetical protein
MGVAIGRDVTISDHDTNIVDFTWRRPGSDGVVPDVL